MFNPWTPNWVTMAEFLHSVSIKITQTSNENKEKYQFEDYQLIKYKIIQANIIRIV